MVDFSDLKRMRKQNSIQDMQDAVAKNDKTGGGEREADDRFWRCTQDKAGNGSAVIRFLPKTDEDKLPWVKLYKYSFEDPVTKKWYIENSLRTLGQDDPVAEANNTLWNTEIKANQEIVKKRKRRVVYITNVLVVDDRAHPENNGLVKLFAFGPKIYEHIAGKINPSFEDIKPVDVFNLWEGANFRLRIRKHEGYANYEKSEWDSPSEVSEDDEQLVNILNSRHFLGEFIDPKNFKPYDVLKKRFEEVTNGKAGSKGNAQRAVTDPDEDDFETKAEAKPAKTKPEPTKVVGFDKKAKSSTLDDDDVDADSFKQFQDPDDDIPF